MNSKPLKIIVFAGLIVLSMRFLLVPGFYYFRYDPEESIENYKTYVRVIPKVDSVIIKEHDVKSDFEKRSPGTYDRLVYTLFLSFEDKEKKKVKTAFDVDMSSRSTMNLLRERLKPEWWDTFSVYYNPGKPEYILTPEQYKNGIEGKTSAFLQAFLLVCFCLGLPLTILFSVFLFRALKA